MADIKVQGPQVQQSQLKQAKNEGKKSLYSDGLGNINTGKATSAMTKATSVTSNQILPDEPTMEPSAMKSFARAGAKVLQRLNEDENNQPNKEGDLSIASLIRFSQGGVDLDSIQEALANTSTIGSEVQGEAEKRNQANVQVMRSEQRVRDLEKVHSDVEKQQLCEAISSKMVSAFQNVAADKKVTGLKGDFSADDPIAKMAAMSAIIGGSASLTDKEVNIARLFLKANAMMKNIEAGNEATKQLGNPAGMARAISAMKGGAGPVAGHAPAGKAAGDIKAE